MKQKYIQKVQKTQKSELSNRALTLALTTTLGLCLSSTVSAHGGNNSGGGGNARVCMSNASIVEKIKAEQNRVIYDDQIKYITKIELLDLYEAENNLSPQFSPEEKGSIVAPKQIDNSNQPGELKKDGFWYYDQITARMQVPSPEVANRLVELENAIPNRRFTAAKQLSPAVDSQEIESYENSNCLVTTMASQSEPDWLIAKDPTSPTMVLVDTRLFNSPKHSAMSRGMTILHERVYSLDRDQMRLTNWDGAPVNSRKARRTVGLMVLKNNLTVENWFDHMQGSEFIFENNSVMHVKTIMDERKNPDHFIEATVSKISNEILDLFHKYGRQVCASEQPSCYVLPPEIKAEFTKSINEETEQAFANAPGMTHEQGAKIAAFLIEQEFDKQLASEVFNYSPAYVDGTAHEIAPGDVTFP